MIVRCGFMCPSTARSVQRGTNATRDCSGAVAHVASSGGGSLLCTPTPPRSPEDMPFPPTVKVVAWLLTRQDVDHSGFGGLPDWICGVVLDTTLAVRTSCAVATVRVEATTKVDRYVMLFTVGVSLWNMGAYLGGFPLWYGFNRGWLKSSQD